MSKFENFPSEEELGVDPTVITTQHEENRVNLDAMTSDLDDDPEDYNSQISVEEEVEKVLSE